MIDIVIQGSVFLIVSRSHQGHCTLDSTGLNKKTATIECDQLSIWHVSHALLHNVIKFYAD